MAQPSFPPMMYDLLEDIIPDTPKWVTLHELNVMHLKLATLWTQTQGEHGLTVNQLYRFLAPAEEPSITYKEVKQMLVNAGEQMGIPSCLVLAEDRGYMDEVTVMDGVEYNKLTTVTLAYFMWTTAYCQLVQGVSCRHMPIVEDAFEKYTIAVQTISNMYTVRVNASAANEWLESKTTNMLNVMSERVYGVVRNCKNLFYEPVL